MTRTTANIDVIAKAIRLACRAPSLHNSQPWRWVVSESVVDLFADYRRVVRSADRSGREAIISCGAALDHFRIVMGAAGWTTTVDQFPSPDDRDHLASLECTPGRHVTAAERDRADAVQRRRTDRLPFRAPSHWESFEPVLRETVHDDRVTLDVVGDDGRPALAAASRRTESFRRVDAYYHDELLWWTDPLRPYQGIPADARVSEDERERVDISRQFPVARVSARRSAVGLDEAKVLVLSTPEDTRLDALACGQVLSTVLLECTMAGLATCPLTHITEFAESRVVIQTLTGSGAFPQVLVRVGRAPPSEEAPTPTPRRPLSEVMQIRRR
jgi:nitroreductase